VDRSAELALRFGTPTLGTISIAKVRTDWTGNLTQVGIQEQLLSVLSQFPIIGAFPLLPNLHPQSHFGVKLKTVIFVSSSSNSSLFYVVNIRTGIPSFNSLFAIFPLSNPCIVSNCSLRHRTRCLQPNLAHKKPRVGFWSQWSPPILSSSSITKVSWRRLPAELHIVFDTIPCAVLFTNLVHIGSA